MHFLITAQTAFHQCTFSFITAHFVHHCTLKQALPRTASDPRQTSNTGACGEGDRAISRFDMSCAQAHWVWSTSIRRVIQLKLHKLTMAARHVNSTNPGQSNLVFRSKPIPEAEMSIGCLLVAFDTLASIWA